MPEIPELEVIAGALNRRVKDRAISSVAVRIPVVLRQPSAQEFTATLTGNSILAVRRAGKYLLASLGTGHTLAVNLMLTGRLQLAEAGSRLRTRTSVVIAFEGGTELRLFGERLDARVYLVAAGGLAAVPQLADMGPDALDPALTLDVFLQRLRRFSGQIKLVLVNHRFIAGIGNAYADEILFEARVYPFEPARNLSEERKRALFEAVHSVYRWAMPLAEQAMGETLEVKPRDFLKVHRKGGQPCPRCGSTITEVAPNQRITSYCRSCQGWGNARLRGSSLGGPAATG